MPSHEARPNLYDYRDEDGKTIIVGGLIEIPFLDDKEKQTKDQSDDSIETIADSE